MTFTESFTATNYNVWPGKPEELHNARINFKPHVLVPRFVL
ncbi:MAG TPA: hypothetical protein VNM72_10530 [Blastocatellia bacterium]|nr:hypothetical protein [Blastocatellia bacterium]